MEMIEPSASNRSAGAVGARILARRLALDLSRETLALRTGSDPLLIFAYEIGQGLPAPMEMAQIARALNISIGFFFGDAKRHSARTDCATESA